MNIYYQPCVFICLQYISNVIDAVYKFRPRSPDQHPAVYRKLPNVHDGPFFVMVFFCGPVGEGC